MVKRTSLEKAECPIARSLDVIGDWWSLLIIRDALMGIRRFSEFQKHIGLAKNILTVRLRGLVDHGILKTAPASDGSAYQEYVLTPKGRGVFPVLVALRQWSEGICRRAGRIPYPAGGSRQRPASSKTRTPFGGWPAARHWRYRSEAEFCRQAPPTRFGVGDAELTLKIDCVCREGGCAPALPFGPSRADARARRAGGAAPAGRGRRLSPQ